MQFLLPKLEFLPQGLYLFFLIILLLYKALCVYCILMITHTIVLVTYASVRMICYCALRHFLNDIHIDFKLLRLHLHAGLAVFVVLTTVSIVGTFRLFVVKRLILKLLFLKTCSVLFSCCFRQ